MTRWESPPAGAISFDVEHWHQATLLREEVSNPADRIEESLTVVLDLLDRHGTRGTFFVVGELAAEYPDLVRRIAAAGHELASHGHTHTPLFGQSPDWFERELRESREAIVEATGVEPVGFRAPNFSITRETAWAIDVLESSRYRYDSSVFPVRTPMYGVADAPTRPFVVGAEDPFRPPEREAAGGIVEFPLSVLEARVRLPLAGGFYARVLPAALFEYGLARNVASGVPVNLYFHPWEFNPAVRTDEPPLHKRFVSFHGIDRLERSVSRLLERFEFGPIGDVLRSRGLLDSGGAGSTSASQSVGPARVED